MTHSSLELLEYEQLRALLGRYISNALGRAELDELAPGTDRRHIQEALAGVGEAIEYARTGTKLPLSLQADPRPIVHKLHIEGAVLDAGELADIVAFLDRATQLRRVLAGEAKAQPRLLAQAGRIGEFRGIIREITGKLLPDRTLADHASVALHTLRRDIEKLKKQIQDYLDRFVRAHREDGVLQEDYITIRNDRLVVPVVSGQKRRVDGVVHGVSNTGQTIFIEPLETIGMNNELVRLREEELREMHRILREMTERLREHLAEIAAALDVTGELDLLFAKAEFAAAFDCTIPKFSLESARRLHLELARHPLLEDVLRREKRPIVPLSLVLDGDTHTLLISGPNTGGKTVAIKTVGLLSIMAQSGVPVPAAVAEFPLFDKVLADIGDQQSIEHSLSTFSAHMASIREMLDRASPWSLIMLDELGRATDPEEGGALGVAILEHFREQRAFALASTHLPALKTWGAGTSGVLNGSMGFDAETLRPTYVLRVGAPGRSAGIDIAARLGLPRRLIERARAALGTAAQDIARLLEELDRRLAENIALKEQLERRVAEVNAQAATLERESDKRLAAQTRDLEARYAALAERFETEARAAIERIAASAEQRKTTAQAQRRVARTRREFDQAFESEIRGVRPSAGPARSAVEEGSRVMLKGVRSPARVRRVLDGGRLEVEAGFMKMQVSLEDVEEVLPAAEEKPRLPTNVAFHSGPRWDSPYQEISVIGQRAEEAVDLVDKFLDRAALAQVARVRIIHGHGMGVLRRAIAELLGRNPHVEKFHTAGPDEGGAGATIAELKGS